MRSRWIRVSTTSEQITHNSVFLKYLSITDHLNMETSANSNGKTASPALLVGSENTNWNTVRFDMTWTIQNFHMYQHIKQILTNTGISMAELGRKDYPGRWRMRVGPGFKDRENLYVHLTLTDITGDGIQEPSYYYQVLHFMSADHAFDSNQRDIYASAELRVTTGRAAGTLIYEGSIAHVFTAKAPSSGRSISTYAALFGSDEPSGQLRDRCITITMRITLSVPQTAFHVAGVEQREFIQRQLQWANSARKHDSDFVLCSMDGREFFVNSILLTAHSPVFAAMLNHDTKEKQLMRCEMEDVDGETLQILLSYLYSCKTGKINGQNAEKVLMMADKYQLMHLRTVSEQILSSNITTENAVYCLRFANLHKLKGLKEASLNVIDEDIGMILGDKELVKNDPEIMRTITTLCAEKARLVAKSWESAATPSQ